MINKNKRIMKLRLNKRSANIKYMNRYLNRDKKVDVSISKNIPISLKTQRSLILKKKYIKAKRVNLLSILLKSLLKNPKFKNKIKKFKLYKGLSFKILNDTPLVHDNKVLDSTTVKNQFIKLHLLKSRINYFLSRYLINDENNKLNTSRLNLLKHKLRNINNISRTGLKYFKVLLKGINNNSLTNKLKSIYLNNLIKASIKNEKSKYKKIKINQTHFYNIIDKGVNKLILLKNSNNRLLYKVNSSKRVYRPYNIHKILHLNYPINMSLGYKYYSRNARIKWLSHNAQTIYSFNKYERDLYRLLLKPGRRRKFIPFKLYRLRYKKRRLYKLRTNLNRLKKYNYKLKRKNRLLLRNKKAKRILKKLKYNIMKSRIIKPFKHKFSGSKRYYKRRFKRYIIENRRYIKSLFKRKYKLRLIYIKATRYFRFKALRRPSLYDKYVSKKFINKRGLWVPPRRWKRLSYKVKNLVKNIKRYKFIKSIKKSQKLHITRGDNRALPYKKTLLELMSKYGINNLNKKNSFIRLKKRLAILKRKSKLYSYNRFSRSSLYSKKWYKKRLSNNYDILNTKVISNIRKSFFKRNNIYSYSIRLKRTLLKRKLNRSLFPRVRTSSPFILRRYHKIKNAINSYAYYKNGFSAYKLMGIGLKSMSNARLPKLNRYKKRGKKRYKKHNKKYELDYKSDYSKFNIKFISKEGKPILFKNSYPESIKSKSVNNYRVLSRKRIAYNIKKRIKSIKYHIRRSIYKNYHKPYLFNKAIKFKYRFGKYRLLLHKGKKYDPRFWNRLEGSKFSHKIRLYRGLFDSLAKVHLLRGINKKYDYNMGKGLYSPLNLLGFKKYHPYRFLRHRALFPRLINNSSYKRIKDYSLYKKVLALRPLINRLNALHMFIRKHNYSYKLSNNKILNDYLVKFNKYNYENNGLIRLYKQNIINYNLLKGINRLMWSRSGATPSSLYHYNSLSERLNYNKIKLNKRNFYYSNSRLYRTKSRLNKKPKLLSQGTRRRWRGLNKRLRWVKRYGYRPKNPFRRLYKRWWRIRGKYELSKKDNKPLSLLSLNNGYPTLMLKSFVNNFIIQVLDKNGKSLTMKTAGSIYEGPQRRTWFAAQNIAFLIGQYLLGRNIKNINVCFRSKFSKHMIEAAKSLMTTTTLIKSKVYDEELGIKRTKNLIRRLRVIGFSILYKRSHNGLRAKKARRV